MRYYDNKMFPSPYLGLSLKLLAEQCYTLVGMVSVPLFGAISEIHTTDDTIVYLLRFRPLIWGYL